MRNEELNSVAASPEGAQALERLWNRCHETGEHGAAIEALGRAIAADGTVARHHYMLGCTLQDAGRTQEAVEAYRKALSLEPGLARAQNNLGCLLEAAGDAEGAMQCYEAALRAEPGLAPGLFNRGNMHKLRGHFALAEEDICRALELEPQRADWRCVLGEVLVVQWNLDAAAANYRVVLKADPGDARAYFGLGNAFLLTGRPHDAETCFRRALERQPGFTQGHSNLLLCLHYQKGDQGRMLYEEHLAWAQRHAGGLAGPELGSKVDRSQTRPLNVGYVSPNFAEHSVASYVEPLLAAHDRTRFRIHCYSNVAHPDLVTQRLMGLCDAWRDISRMGDDEAARLIRQDRIDILVDLAGHTGGARPLLFARKPAPVQVTWLGYPDTTGLEQMDYRITDVDADPEGEADSLHSEKLVRLATGFLCYAPHPESPPVAGPPVLESGRITFGSFNSLPKVTAEVIALWSRILAGVPQSRLVLKAHALVSAKAQRIVRAHFARCGIAKDRIELHGAEESPRRHLERYGAVDIALDTYPYHGTTTTCEALWMGVPVVTLAGSTHVSRVGASLLKRVGLSELIAESPDEYVMKAIALARDPGRVRELRDGLRQRMRASPLLDAAAFARALERSYRQMWAGLGGPLRLNIGGKERREGWKILNIQPGKHVDFVGDCADLGQFADGSVEELYASHVLEHVCYGDEIKRTLAGFHRVLRPGGTASISVPDFEVLCRLFLDPRATTDDRFHVMRMAFGGQEDAHDFHRIGLSYEFLELYLLQAGFARVERVPGFGIFNDTSTLRYLGEPISLNVLARK